MLFDTGRSARPLFSDLEWPGAVRGAMRPIPATGRSPASATAAMGTTSPQAVDGQLLPVAVVIPCG